MYMALTTSSNQCMCIDLLFTIGSGVRTGVHGTALGIGGITRVGGMFIVAGRMIGIGITAMLSIIVTTTALSVLDALYAVAIVNCVVE